MNIINLTRYAGAALLATSIMACNGEQSTIAKVEKEQELSADANRIQAHLEFLADDALEGRDTGSRGYQIAANYVAAEFKKMGLTPQGDVQEDGTKSFAQHVPLVKSVRAQSAATMTVEHDGKMTELSFPKQFISSSDPMRAESNVNAELVFAGYGIVAPEFGHDDYANIDVEGKIVVSFYGRPDAWPSEEGAHLGSGREKYKHAAERGAAGFITVHTPKREKVRGYATYLMYLSTPSIRWVDNEGVTFGFQENMKGSAIVSTESAQTLFEGSSVSLDELFTLDNDNQPLPQFDLPSKLSMATATKTKSISSTNIIASIEGSDPALKDEYVVFTAHLDHIGLAKDITTKDRINNGALDNAAGVATLLETARILLADKANLKRSVLFTVVTGEEKGLVGSSYFANNPTVPLESMVANINLDMPVLLYPFADIIAFGSNHSSLGPTVAEAAKKYDIALSEDPMPEQSIFVRSDHYNFVKQGIPSVFIATGFTSKDENQNGGEIWMEFFKTHYHKPSDSIDLDIDYDTAVVFTNINANIGRVVANNAERPTWNEGDFFGNIFKK